MTHGRTIALLALAGALLAACAQPGQLGSPTPEPALAPPPVAAPAQPPPPTAPPLEASGVVEEPVTVRTPGPAVFSVRTVVLEPGDDTGWHRHPGTEMSIVSSGAVMLVSEDDCEGTAYSSGDAMFVPDAEPHLARNDGDVPAELVVTYLLAPGAQDGEDVPDAC